MNHKHDIDNGQVPRRFISAPVPKLPPPLSISEGKYVDAYRKQQELQGKRIDDEGDKYLTRILTSWPAQLLVPVIGILSVAYNPDVIGRALGLSVLTLFAQNTGAMWISFLEARIFRTKQEILSIKRQRADAQHAAKQTHPYGGSADSRGYFDEQNLPGK